MLFEDFIGSARSVSWAFRFWPVLVSAWVFALAATWLCKKIALRLGIVDKPDHFVKTHKEPVAYLGGLGILVGLPVGILAGITLIQDCQQFGRALSWLLGILAGGAVACFVGLVDDVLDIRPWQKLLGQFIASMALIAVVFEFDVFRRAARAAYPRPAAFCVRGHHRGIFCAGGIQFAESAGRAGRALRRGNGYHHHRNADFVDPSGNIGH